MTDPLYEPTMSVFDALGDRMKRYEAASQTRLPPRMPLIIRLDGKAFHTWTRGMSRPWDNRLISWMDHTAMALCQEIQGTQIAYVQSDEISLLVHNYKRFTSQPWMDCRIQKMVSVSAAVASAAMTINSDRPAYFDSRAFVLPESEVTNYFLWRQNDATRNSVQMLARSLYSHAECDDKCNAELQEMCFQKGKNWNDLPTHLKRGRCIVRETYWGDDGCEPPGAIRVQRSRWVVDNEIPIWKADGREYIERLLVTEEVEK